MNRDSSTLQPSPEPQPWHEGWYSKAQQCQSPNFGARPAQIQPDLIVLHSISLPPGKWGTGAVAQLFCNTLNWDAHPYFKSIQGLRVSCHFFIERTGTLWQFVSCDQRAWHAGESCYRGRNNCNDDSIGIELEGLEGDYFEPAQYASLTHLCQAIAAHYPIQHLAGHEHIAPQRKKDPGAGFNWPLLKNELNWPATYFPIET